MDNNTLQLKRRIESLSEKELIDIVWTSSKDYTIDAINFAKEELLKRGSNESKKRLLTAEDERKREEEKKRNESLNKRLLEANNNPQKVINDMPKFNATKTDKSFRTSSELLVEKRHLAIRSLMRFGNFIGWLLCITLLFLPVGLALLYLGHITLASIETEQNTRELVTIMRTIYR